MRLPFGLAACVVAILILAHPRIARAEPPSQVNATVEIYELPQPEAITWQEKYEKASDAERQKLIHDLRVENFGEVKTIGFAHRLCTVNESSTVETVEMYHYPTHFETKDGFASPSDFEMNKIGCTMTLKVAAAKDENRFAVDTNIRDVALLATQRYPASKTDQPGSIEQPAFAFHSITTRFQLAANVPKLVSVYSPYRDDKSAHVLRLVFVTVGPDR